MPAGRSPSSRLCAPLDRVVCAAASIPRGAAMRFLHLQARIQQSWWPQNAQRAQRSHLYIYMSTGPKCSQSAVKSAESGDIYYGVCWRLAFDLHEPNFGWSKMTVNLVCKIEVFMVALDQILIEMIKLTIWTSYSRCPWMVNSQIIWFQLEIWINSYSLMHRERMNWNEMKEICIFLVSPWLS
jgi:hypothetical protein